MKGQLLAACILLLGLLAVVPHAEASTNCHATGNWCQGEAEVRVSASGVTGSRCFYLSTDSNTQTCTPASSNQATWKLDAGACITLYWFETITSSATVPAPNKVTAAVKLDNSATDAIAFQTLGARPGAGTTWSFCATSTGLTGASPRAGTYRLYIRAVKDNAVGGIGNYDVDSDGTATVATIDTFDKGALVAKMCISVTQSAYPSGSTFAYGPAADEVMTISATVTQPNLDANAENLAVGIWDSATKTLGELGSQSDLDGTTFSGTFTADNSYTTANGPWQPYVRIYGTAALTSTAWTDASTTAGCLGAGMANSSTNIVYQSATFNIDPGVKFDSDGSGGYSGADDLTVIKLGSSSGAAVSVLNKGETFYAEWYLYNARSEYVTRSMTFAREDSTPTTCNSGSISAVSSKYSTTSTLATSSVCLTTATTTGSPRYFRATNTDQNHRSGQLFGVSSLYFVDSHIQLSGTLVKDDFPTEDSAEDTSYRISTAVTDTTHGWCHVKSVRKDVDVDTSGSAVTWTYLDSTPTSRLTGTTDTASDGWTSTHLDLLASTPLGSWTFRCAATFNGNTGTTDQTFTVAVPAGATIAEGDPLRVSCTPNLANPSETVTCTAAESNADGSARTGNAAGTFYDLWNPSNTQIVTGGATTEIGSTGNYRFTYSPGASPTLGNYIVVVRTTDASPVTTSTAFTIETDPTIALASNIATLLSDHDAQDTALATAATAHATAATAHTNLQADTDDLQVSASHADAHHHTIEAAISSAVTTIDGHTDAEVATILDAVADASDLSSSEHQAMMDRLDQMVQNGTFQNGTLASILQITSWDFENDTAHREHSLELSMNNDFQGIGFDGFLFFVLFLVLLIFFWWQEMKFAAAWTIPAIFTAIVPGFEFSLLISVVFIVIGVAMQFFKEKEAEKEAEGEPA